MCEPPLGCFIVLEIQATKEHFLMLKKQLQPRDWGSNRQTKPSEADVFSGLFFLYTGEFWHTEKQTQDKDVYC